MMPSTGMPTPQAPGQAPMGAPVAGGQGQGQPNPEQVKQMLMEIITKARQLAQESGLDFDALVAGTGGSGSPQVPPPPRPPAM